MNYYELNLKLSDFDHWHDIFVVAQLLFSRPRAKVVSPQDVKKTLFILIAYSIIKMVNTTLIK